MNTHCPLDSPGEDWESVAHCGYPLINISSFLASCPHSSLELPPVVVGFMCRLAWAKGCPKQVKHYLLAGKTLFLGCFWKNACVHACCLFSPVWLFVTCGLYPPRLLCPWDSPGKNIGVGCHALLLGIFLTQGLNPCMAPAHSHIPYKYLGDDYELL